MIARYAVFLIAESAQMKSLLTSPLPNSFKTDLLDLVPVLIAVHDTDLNIVWANKAYQKTARLSWDAIEGQKCFSIWGLAKPCRACPVSTAIETETRQESGLTPLNQDHCPISQGSWLSKAVPIKDQSATVIGVGKLFVNQCCANGP